MEILLQFGFCLQIFHNSKNIEILGINQTSFIKQTLQIGHFRGF